MNSDMSHVIDDATSALHDTYDETTSMLDNTVPLCEFLNEQLVNGNEHMVHFSNKQPQVHFSCEW